MPISKKKKEAIRNQIIIAANEYRNNLSGNVYLYVVDSKYFEVAFLTGCFKHLTGVNSNVCIILRRGLAAMRSRAYFFVRSPVERSPSRDVLGAVEMCVGISGCSVEKLFAKA